jgi:hypothetical protein
MTFTYDLTNGFTNLTRVRFNVGDVDASRAIWQDEVINAVITDAGSWQKAVILLIQSVIAMLSSNPDFHADWLTVSYDKAIASWTALLNLKSRELGVPSGQIVATALYIYRPDSFQTTEPTYPLDGPGGDLPNMVG